MKIENINNAVTDLKNALLRRFGDDVAIILFGSAARGTCDDESDIDVLVLVPEKVDTSTEEEIFSIAYNIELDCDVVFGIIVYSKDFWNSGLAGVMPLHTNIEHEGIVV
jgi:predicted nucleotidyltransferase